MLKLTTSKSFGAGFAGFNVKNEITVEGNLNRGNYQMTDIHLHHNYVHDTGGEGFYVGNTWANGKDINNDNKLEYPHFIEDLLIEHNLVRDTGAEGIWAGSTRRGMIVRFNTIENAGIDPFANFQNNGMRDRYVGGPGAWQHD